MTRQISALQFFDGVMAALTLGGRGEFSLRNAAFDRAFEATYNRFVSDSDQLDVQPLFRIKTDPLSRESRTVRDVIPRAAQLGIISLDNPSFHSKRIVVDRMRAERSFGSLPLPQAYFTMLAAVFLENYADGTGGGAGRS